MNDPPDIIAMVDQAVETSRQIARWHGALFRAYVVEGFTRDEALALVSMIQNQPATTNDDDAA